MCIIVGDTDFIPDGIVGTSHVFIEILWWRVVLCMQGYGYGSMNLIPVCIILFKTVVCCSPRGLTALSAPLSLVRATRWRVTSEIGGTTSAFTVPSKIIPQSKVLHSYTHTRFILFTANHHFCHLLLTQLTTHHHLIMSNQQDHTKLAEKGICTLGMVGGGSMGEVSLMYSTSTHLRSRYRKFVRIEIGFTDHAPISQLASWSQGWAEHAIECGDSVMMVSWSRSIQLQLRPPYQPVPWDAAVCWHSICHPYIVWHFKG